MKGYKAFEKGLICRGKQYAENTIFEEEGDIKICERGIHFCRHPLDVFLYYFPYNINGDITEFAEVRTLEDSKICCNDTSDSKVCTNKLYIGEKISFQELIQASKNIKEYSNQTLYDSKSSEELKNDCYEITRIASSYNCVKINNRVMDAIIATSGTGTHIDEFGTNTKIITSGDYTLINNYGLHSDLIGMGDNLIVFNCGYHSKIWSLGNCAKISSFGNDTIISSCGKDAIISAVGPFAKVSAKKGSWITLAEYTYRDEMSPFVVKNMKTEQVDGKKIKEDTFYTLFNGEFTEVPSLRRCR